MQKYIITIATQSETISRSPFRITISIMVRYGGEAARDIYLFRSACGPGGTRPIRKPGGPPAEEEGGGIG